MREHGRAEVHEAKQKEIENLQFYKTYEEIDNIGQESITMRWVITAKEQHDGQKQAYESRLVARGFQETDKPQSDSPTALRESMKLFLAMAAVQGFDLRALDICVAFLQAEPLKREIFIRPPKDISKDGVLWKLLKPIYGLDDTSRRFWLTVRRIFKEEGLNPITGDEAFYVKRVEGKLVGSVLTHVDDFLIAGSPDFIKKLTDAIEKNLTISKIEDNEFRFAGIDIKKEASGITISMEDCAKSMEEVTDIRKG